MAGSPKRMGLAETIANLLSRVRALERKAGSGGGDTGPAVQAGIVVVPPPATAGPYTTFAVEFDTPMTGTPTIQLTVGDYPAEHLVAATGLSTTGFTIQLRRHDGSNIPGNIRVHWWAADLSTTELLRRAVERYQETPHPRPLPEEITDD